MASLTKITESRRAHRDARLLARRQRRLKRLAKKEGSTLAQLQGYVSEMKGKQG